jgi:hypothetical protein
MKTVFASVACGMAVAVAASAAAVANGYDPALMPGRSAIEGNRIVCEGPGVGFHQSPGLCAQAVGEAYGFTGGPGQAWKFMRDMGMEVSNAHDCISQNCGSHAQDPLLPEEDLMMP